MQDFSDSKQNKSPSLPDKGRHLKEAAVFGCSLPTGWGRVLGGEGVGTPHMGIHSNSLSFHNTEPAGAC